MTGRSHREPDLGERDPKRVIAFSDGVIAIAVTLLVLNLRPPDDTRHLVHGLLALWPSYVSYIITFMLVGNVWANHHVMFDHIRHADRMVLFLNCVLLMDVAVIPFAAAVLANSFRAGQGGAPPSSCTASCSSWRPPCSMSSGGMPGVIAGCSPALLTPPGSAL